MMRSMSAFWLKIVEEMGHHEPCPQPLPVTLVTNIASKPAVSTIPGLACTWLLLELFPLSHRSTYVIHIC